MKKTIAEIKELFQSGDMPRGVDFEDLIDTLHDEVVGTTIYQTNLGAMIQNSATAVNGFTVLAVYEVGSGVDIVPTMSSNILPNGEASTTAGEAAAAYLALDGNASTYWRHSALPCFLQYKFDTPKAVAYYTLLETSRQDLVATAWTFEGSNNGSTWTVLDSRSNITNWTGLNTFTVTLPQVFLYYRLNFTDKSGSNIDITAWAMYTTGTYNVLTPGIDYSLSRAVDIGSTSITIKRLKASTAVMVVDYI